MLLFFKKINRTFLISLFFLGLWISVSAFINSAQFGDNFEQFNWAHHAEWGYWKHPPLTTWLLILVQSLIGFHPFNTYLLAFICLGTTLYFYHRSAELLLSKKSADIALLLLSASFMFTWRAQIFNHNTSLTMMTAILTWQFFYLMQKKEVKTYEWFLLGLTSALALLAKYQSIVIFLSLLLILVIQHPSTKQKIYGLSLSFLICLIGIAPHLYWIYNHSLLIMSYTTDRFDMNSAFYNDQFKNLLGFLVQQIRLFLVSFIIFFICKIYGKKFNQSFLPPSWLSIYRTHRAWLWGLCFMPLILIIVLSMLSGLRLQNHWGMAIFLFLPMGLASLIQIKNRKHHHHFLIIYIFLQMVSIAIFIDVKTGDHVLKNSNRVDVRYPAKLMASTVMASWQSKTHCPLKIISGPAFEGGIISVYSNQYPAVLEGGDYAKSPWINKDLLDKDGALILSDSKDALNQFGKIYAMPDSILEHYPYLNNLYWAIMLPANDCKGT